MYQLKHIRNITAGMMISIVAASCWLIISVSSIVIDGIRVLARVEDMSLFSRDYLIKAIVNIFMGPVVWLLIGFVIGMIAASLYNVWAKRIGGVELEFELLNEGKK